MCSFDDGSGVVRLYDVGSSDPMSPLINGWKLPSEDIYYYYNPCYPFSKSPITETAACVYNTTHGSYCEIGQWDTMTFTYNGVNVVAEYGGDDCGFQSITTVVPLICDPLVDAPVWKALGRLTESVVGFSVRSRRLCPIADITTEEATTDGQTTPHDTTEIPFTTPEETTLGTTSKPAILCDYKTLLGDTLKRCVFVASDSFVTPFAPPYLNTSKGEASQFCSNIQWVNKCVQDAIQSCSFDGRVTAFFGSSGLGLQAAYDSLCAHPSNVSLPAFNCLTLRRVEDYQAPLNEFIITADESSNPSEMCAFGSYMVSSMTYLTAVYCDRWFKVWTLFWDNFMAGCQ